LKLSLTLKAELLMKPTAEVLTVSPISPKIVRAAVQRMRRRPAWEKDNVNGSHYTANPRMSVKP
jgi:hypothetical protein